MSLYFFEDENFNDNFLYKLYYSIAIISSTLSVIWHLISEPSIGIVMTLDYMFAYLWVSIELLISIIYFDFIVLETVLLLNGIVGIVYIVNKLIDSDNRNKYCITYTYSHSIWHVISFTKCISISYLLNNLDKNM
jgi:hypothetical protein